MTNPKFQPCLRTSRRAPRAAVLTLGLIYGSFAQPVFADDTGNAERADQLFSQGKQQMAQNEFDQACPLLAASFEADPATGSLLALAICHEREGKFASAVQEYARVVTLAKSDGRADREQAAQQRIVALTPQLSTLTIEVQQSVQPTSVWLDGVAIDGASLGTAMPVDGGAHRVEALFSNAQRFSTEIAVANSGAAERVTLVEPVAPAAPAELDARASTAPQPAASHRFRLTRGQYVALGTMAAGVVSLGTAGVLAIIATNKNQTSKASCDDDLCTEHGRTQRLAARHAGDAATGAMLAAGVFAIVGVAVFFAEGQPAERSGYAASVWAAPAAAGAQLRGEF